MLTAPSQLLVLLMHGNDFQEDLLHNLSRNQDVCGWLALTLLATFLQMGVEFSSLQQSGFSPSCYDFLKVTEQPQNDIGLLLQLPWIHLLPSMESCASRWVK